MAAIAGTERPPRPAASAATLCREAGALFWLRWVAANSLGELVGLGGTALVAAVLFTRLGDSANILATLMAAAGAVVLGALVEGAAVGGMQWLVLHRALPDLGGRSWMRATVLGAGIAWALGMVPSTVMSLASDGSKATAAPSAEPSEAVVYVLAALMGLVLGPGLGVPQWRVLRRHVGRAAVWWIAANALAWAAGMPIVFAGVGLVVDGHGPLAARVAGVAGMLTLTGAVVGAVHGLFLLRLLRRNSHR